MGKIVNHKGSFVVPNVFYRGEKRTYEIFEEMAPAMTQNRLVEFHENEKQKGNPYLIDCPLHFAIFLAAYNLTKQSPEIAEQLRNFIHDGIKETPSTLTRIVYNIGETDEIVHYCGTSEKYSTKRDVIGRHGYINDIKDKKALELILGVKDVGKVVNFFNWVNGTNGYFWRLEAKPKKDPDLPDYENRVVGLSFGGVGFGINCGRSTFFKYPAFRVLRID
ncbi:MAG: hypothetical protein AABW51_02985 [Nanoarchaeota archaeon]